MGSVLVGRIPSNVPRLRRREWFVLCALTAFLGCAALALAQGDGEKAKRIKIKSTVWNGKKTITQKLTIRATKTGYSAGDRRIDSDSIRELLTCLNSSPQPLSLAALGIDQDWLNRNAHSAIGQQRLSPAQIEKFVSAFRDESTFLKAVKTYYTDIAILDDDASFELELVEMDGSKIRLRSFQSQAYMLPWEISSATRKFETYDVRISRAVFRLLPDGFLNRSRIEGRRHGEDFSSEIGDMGEFQPER